MEEQQTDINNISEVFPKADFSLRSLSQEKHQFRPSLFKHQALMDVLESADTIDQESIINMMNRIRFMDGHILTQFDHSKFEESILIKAYPINQSGTELTCRLSKQSISGLDLGNYHFRHLVIDDGRVMIVIPTTLKAFKKKSLTVQLPLQGYKTGERGGKRYPCHGVDVEMIQNGRRASGELMDFSPDGFRIKVNPDSIPSSLRFRAGAIVIVHLQHNQKTFFSGTCYIIRQSGKTKNKEIVLAPLEKKLRPINKKRSRNIRQTLVPSPTVLFKHAILGKRIQLEVHDISPSGFSVFEDINERTLMPGMIIPDLTIHFHGGLEIQCDAQVIYCQKGANISRSGLGILDMSINEYNRLTQIISNAIEEDGHITGEADMDKLWEFFFETGFIYPKKYRSIHSHKEEFKIIYQKIYQDNPEIAKQFIYQQNGKIYGYISMVRAYEHSWMMHHYAARVVRKRRKGFNVLQQLIHYLNDMHHLPSAKMEYLMCYFRPENKFPDRAFGGFARALQDPKACSLDLLAYLSYPTRSLGTRLPRGWFLRESSELDVWKLNRFYNYSSGGLFLDALDLENENTTDEPLEEVYKRLGFIRKWTAFSLTYKDELNAVLIVNQSNLGLNFSELLRGIKVIVTNPESLHWNVLSIAIAQLTGIYRANKIPVLIYPFDYVKARNIPYEKQYQLCILSVMYVNEYMNFMENRFKVVH